jgi:hypothetical protein
MANRLDALTVRESNDKSFWTKIGVAFQNRDGNGYRVLLDAMPAPTDGQFVIHLREPRENGNQGGGQRSQRPREGDDGYIPGFD